ncbi:hypothetical protein [Chitinimonas sp.]|uniref:hypothetical protein n=1 Tax=Chitinimonas sp. TaxID=1934313 RepID=UPI0035B0BDB9
MKRGTAAIIAFIVLSIGCLTSATAAPADQANLGSAPTYYYSISFDKMFDLAMKDAKEGRKHFDANKASYLDQYVLKSANVPDSTPGKFTAFAPAPNLMCLTIAYIYVPTGTSGGGGIGTPGSQEANISRNCAPSDSSLWAQAPRSTIGSNIGLGRTLANYGLAVKSNQFGGTVTTGLKTASFGPAVTGVGAEAWGQIYFNTWGNNAVAVDVFIVYAQWI